jgi:hypothetical protein
MALTNEALTLWELGHRLAGEDPHAWRPFGPSLAVRDNFRMLLNEILNYNLISSLIMEKWDPKADTSEDMHIRYYLDTIGECIDRGKCSKTLLKAVWVPRGKFWGWCQQSNYPLPDFWFAYEYRMPAEEGEVVPEGNEGAPPDHPDKLRPNQRIRVACQQIASQLWKEAPTTTIADMIRNDAIQRLGGAANFEDKTVREWLKPIAPPAVRNKRGRPRKT